MSEILEQFETLMDTLSKDDIQWLLAESSTSFGIPSEHAPSALIKHNLVTRTMIRSGRNPEYGYAITPDGNAFASWIRTSALRIFLSEYKDI